MQKHIWARSRTSIRAASSTHSFTAAGSMPQTLILPPDRSSMSAAWWAITPGLLRCAMSAPTSMQRTSGAAWSGINESTGQIINSGVLGNAVWSAQLSMDPNTYVYTYAPNITYLGGFVGVNAGKIEQSYASGRRLLKTTRIRQGAVLSGGTRPAASSTSAIPITGMAAQTPLSRGSSGRTTGPSPMPIPRPTPPTPQIIGGPPGLSITIRARSITPTSPNSQATPACRTGTVSSITIPARSAMPTGTPSANGRHGAHGQFNRGQV